MIRQPQFKSPAAQQIWDRYFAEVERLLAQAGLTDSGLGEELRTRLFEGFNAQPGEREVPRLEAVIGRLGRPAEYLRQPLAVALLDRGARSFNPLTIGRGLWHALLTGTRTALIGGVFALGYAALLGFAVLVVFKPYLFDSIGLFRAAPGGGGFAVAPPAAAQAERVGLWAIPIGLAVTGTAFVGLTLLLRRLRKR